MLCYLVGLEVIPLCLEAAKALTRPNLISSKTFLLLSLGSNKYPPGGFMVNALLMMGAPKGPTENGSGDAGN